LNLIKNNWRQIVESLTCPLNRAMTMVEHGCNETELFAHPEWLINHYIEKGGAVAFAQRRKDALDPEPAPDPEPDTEYYI